MSTLVEEAEKHGIVMRTWSPGDGATRYRFFASGDPKQSYFGPENGIFTALGRKEADAYLTGRIHGRSDKGGGP